MADNNNRLSRRDVLKGAAGVGAASLAGVASAEGRPDRKIVGLTAEAGFEVATRRADEVRRTIDFDHVGKAVAGRFPDEALEGLRNNPQVRYVEDDGEYRALGQTLPWGIDRVDADLAHGDGYTGSGADVAIIDTGIDDDHPDLQANIGTGKCFADECCGQSGGCRFGAQPNDNDCNYAWSDDNDHGTHCAGSADAVDNTDDVVGVSTEATLHAAKVLNGCGSGSLSAVADGIRWVADQGYDVGSMSLGASSGDQTLKDACQYAYDNGVLLVAAAGNDGPCSDCVGYPAAYSTVIAVSATTKDDQLADFSSTGPEVELAAPGKDVLSTVPPESSSDGTDTFSGTSMACPHVSGAGGLLMAEGQSNTEARSTLQDSAEDIGLSDNEQGYGLLDAEAATNALGSGGDTSVAVSTGDATNVGTDSATLNGSLDDLGGADSADVYFEYGESGTSLDQTSSTKTLSSTGSFSVDVSGLSSGTDYDYRAVASASDGDTDTGSTKTFTTDSSSGGDTAPAIDEFALTNNSNPAWTRYTVDWAVSDADGDLDTVLVEMLDSGGSVVDSATTDVSGSSASGSDEVRTKGSASEIRLTVTDANGNGTSSTKSI